LDVDARTFFDETILYSAALSENTALKIYLKELQQENI